MCFSGRNWRITAETSFRRRCEDGFPLIVGRVLDESAAAFSEQCCRRIIRKSGKCDFGCPEVARSPGSQPLGVGLRALALRLRFLATAAQGLEHRDRRKASANANRIDFAPDKCVAGRRGNGLAARIDVPKLVAACSRREARFTLSPKAV